MSWVSATGSREYPHDKVVNGEPKNEKSHYKNDSWIYSYTVTGFNCEGRSRGAHGITRCKKRLRKGRKKIKQTVRWEYWGAG